MRPRRGIAQGTTWPQHPNCPSAWCRSHQTQSILPRGPPPSLWLPLSSIRLYFVADLALFLALIISLISKYQEARGCWRAGMAAVFLLSCLSAGHRKTQAVSRPEEASVSALDALLVSNSVTPPSAAGLPGADVWDQADPVCMTACWARPGWDPGSLVDVYWARVCGWSFGTYKDTMKRRGMFPEGRPCPWLWSCLTCHRWKVPSLGLTTQRGDNTAKHSNPLNQT